MSEPVTFGVVGSGWRSHFHLRMAAAAPDRLRVAGVVTQTPEEGAKITARWGVPAYPSIEALLAAARPEFVVAAVSWPSMPVVVRQLVAAGMPTLAETPPAPDLAGLRALWTDVGHTGLVSVAEQYTLMPGHASRLAVVRDGVIGQATSVEVASTHLYHAVSLVREYLGVGTEEVVVNARQFTAPLVDPLRFDGWHPEATPEARPTTIATLDFGDGRTGLYNFVDNQWWNPLRERRLVVRGSLGELVDDTVVRMVGPDPVTSHLEYRRTGRDMNLEGNEVVHVAFDGRVVYRNPFVGTNLSEDDVAVATFLENMGRYVRGEGPEPYSLVHACQDHAIGLAIEESARIRADVRVAKEVWA